MRESNAPLKLPFLALVNIASKAHGSVEEIFHGVGSILFVKINCTALTVSRSDSFLLFARWNSTWAISFPISSCCDFWLLVGFSISFSFQISLHKEPVTPTYVSCHYLRNLCCCKKFDFRCNFSCQVLLWQRRGRLCANHSWYIIPPAFLWYLISIACATFMSTAVDNFTLSFSFPEALTAAWPEWNSSWFSSFTVKRFFFPCRLITKKQVYILVVRNCLRTSELMT